MNLEFPIRLTILFKISVLSPFIAIFSSLLPLDNRFSVQICMKKAYCNQIYFIFLFLSVAMRFMCIPCNSFQTVTLEQGYAYVDLYQQTCSQQSPFKALTNSNTIEGCFQFILRIHITEHAQKLHIVYHTATWSTTMHIHYIPPFFIKFWN